MAATAAVGESVDHTQYTRAGREEKEKYATGGAVRTAIGKDRMICVIEESGWTEAGACGTYVADRNNEGEIIMTAAAAPPTRRPPR